MKISVQIVDWGSTAVVQQRYRRLLVWHVLWDNIHQHWALLIVKIAHGKKEKNIPCRFGGGGVDDVVDDVVVVH